MPNIKYYIKIEGSIFFSSYHYIFITNNAYNVYGVSIKDPSNSRLFVVTYYVYIHIMFIIYYIRIIHLYVYSEIKRFAVAIRQ